MAMRNMQCTEKAMEAVWRKARLELSGGSKPDFLRPRLSVGLAAGHKMEDCTRVVLMTVSTTMTTYPPHPCACTALSEHRVGVKPPC